MPKLERWEEKAIGRMKRFENTTYEYFTNKLYEGAMSVANYLAKGAIRSAASATENALKDSKPVQIKGKNFNEDTSLTQKVGMKIAGAAAETAFDMAEDMADGYFNRNYFYPDGTAVASAAFSGNIVFDEALGTDMFNHCGYAPDFQAVLKGLHATASKGGNTLTDITWRKKVMPHIIRTTYQEELEKCFDAIRKQHDDSTSAIYNRQLVEAQMNTAAQRLGGIFQKFTLDLANNTDYLEAPMSFLPQEPATHKDVEMSEDEKKLLAGVSRHSLFAEEIDLHQQIAREAKKLSQPTTQQLWEKFKHNLDRPMSSPEGKEQLYVRGKDPVEDNRRLMTSVLNLREMKHRYERRNFFSRYLTRGGRAERAAIRNMQDYMLEMLGVDAKTVSSLLDQKNPLENGIAVSEILGIQRKVPEKTPEKAPDPSKPITEQVTEAAQATRKVVTQAAKAIVNEVSNTVSEMKDIINNGVLSDFGDDFQLFADDDLEIFGFNPEPSPPANEKPQEKKVEEKQNEEKPEEEKKPEEKQSESVINKVSNFASSITNTVSDKIMGNFMDGVQLFTEEDDYELFGSQPNPSPSAKGETVLEDLQQDKPKEAEPEEIKSGEHKPEPKEQAVPQEESTSYFGSAWSGVKSAASWFNPFSYSYFSSKPAVSLQQLQDKQKEIASNALENFDGATVNLAVAKLLYYKTLEISLQENKITPETLEASLSEESVAKNIANIQKEPAFKKLDMFQYKKGKVKETIAANKQLLENVSKDSAAANAIHREYLQNLQKPAMERAPEQQKESAVKEKPPASQGTMVRS